MASAVALLLLVAFAAAQPQLDFTQLGTVAVLGDFAALALVDPSSSSHPFSPTAASLVARRPDGSLVNLGSTSAGGRIGALCQTSTGAVFLGGRFTSVGGTPASNVARFEPATGSFASLGPGVDGEVSALTCDGSTVYVGGAFGAPVGAAAGYAGHVAAWSTNTSTWAPLPFAGLNGPVASIASSLDGKSLFFGGSFTTAFSNSSNLTAPSSPTSIPSLGSSLVPISLNQSQFTASPTSYISGFGNAQHVFCPKAADGIGSSWLLVDHQAGYFISRLFRPLNVGGVRLGNTFYQGRGTANFSFVSIPDDQVLTLTYRSNASDPNSPLATCSNNCPLSHDPTLPYQDFVFPANTTLTGFQLNVFGFYGLGGGLHLLQLLSDGSYAYAVDSLNTVPCNAGLGASMGATVSKQGNWTTSSIVTSIPGTTQPVLTGAVAGGSTPAGAPTLSWSPYVVQSGIYKVFFASPGCQIQGTCASRTTVSVSVQPAQGGPATTTTVDQRNTLDTSTLVYSGPLLASAGTTGGAVITMGLAQGGAPTAGTAYLMVAEKISLVALSPNGTAVASVSKGNGLYEFAIDGGTGAFGDAVAPVSTLNASAVLSNATGFDSLAFKFASGASVATVVSVGTGSAERVFVGGSFVYSDGAASSTNVISYSASGVLAAPNGGLAGSVTALVVLDGVLYAAGSFVATVDGKVTGLDGAARWTYGASGGAWAQMGNVPAVGGSIVTLGVVNTGANNSIIALAGDNSGLAVYDPASTSWNTTAAGLIVGNLTAFGPAPSGNSSAPTYFAGNVLAAQTGLAPGGAVISTGQGGKPVLTPLALKLVSPPTPKSAVKLPSSRNNRTGRSLMRDVVGLVSKSLSMRSELVERAPATPINFTLPSALPSSPGSSILAGAFWTNGTTPLVLLGGSFTTNSSVSNLGLYDPAAATIVALPGETIAGTVKALAVFGNTAWIGGAFATSSGRQGLSTFDLGRMLSNDSGPMFQGYNGYNATVSTIVQRPSSTENVIVAGSFAAAGSLPCQSICQWNTQTSQWSPFGAGLLGSVGSLAFAGTDSQYMLATGSFQINGTSYYVAQWDFTTMQWSALGDAAALAGPTTAVSADNGNDSNIFIAGVSLGGDSPFLSRWNGSRWTDFNAGTLQPGSGVQQMVFVPLVSSTSSVAPNDTIESDRILLVSGNLRINNTNYASALYDGTTWYPYLTASTASGAAGVVSQLVYSITNFNLSGRRHLAVGIVILISIAIALGVVFLVVLVGILAALARRKEEPSYPVRDNGNETPPNENRRPSSLLANVGAATAILLDGKSKTNEKSGVIPLEKSRSFDTTDGAALSFEGDNPEVDSTARARYSFTGEHPGELSVRAGEDLVILETSDLNWWLVSNGTSRGLIPSAYVA